MCVQLRIKLPYCFLKVFEASHILLVNEDFRHFVFLSDWASQSHLIADTHADNPWYSIVVVLLCASLIANDAQALLMCLATVHSHSLINCCYRALHIFFFNLTCSLNLKGRALCTPVCSGFCVLLSVSPAGLSVHNKIPWGLFIT